MSAAAGRGAGGRAGGREGRDNQAGGRGRGPNQNRTSPAFKNPIEGLKPFGYGDATHPSIFEEVWEGLANRWRQTGAEGAPEVVAAIEQLVAPTVDIPDPPLSTKNKIYTILGQESARLASAAHGAGTRLGGTDFSNRSPT